MAKPRSKSNKTKQLYNEIRYVKFRSELQRILYYWIEGYDADHPWGIMARPPFPETIPLSIKDPKAGKETRDIIQDKLQEGRWSTNLRNLLREIEKDYKEE